MKRTIKSKTLTNNVIIFLFGLLVGIIASMLIIMLFNIDINILHHKYFNNLNKKSHLNNQVKHNKINNNTALKNNATNNYEFYNLLPKMHPSPNENSANQQENHNKITNNKINKYYYYIQTGIFNKIVEADELKAKLTLQGFEAIIEAYPTKLGDRYKVLIGPYASEETAKINKKHLEMNGFKNVFIRLNKN